MAAVAFGARDEGDDHSDRDEVREAHAEAGSRAIRAYRFTESEHFGEQPGAINTTTPAMKPRSNRS